ncbi:MAG: nuclear transport factor 2 family protein [Balneolaceae bacterium]
MLQNTETLTRFYSALQKLDYETMADCYHADATFRDPVFQLHTKNEITAMWKMLCLRAKEFELNFSDIQADDDSGSAHVEAYYLFSQIGRKVHNKIDAAFRFKDGKIVDHLDTFSFWRWSRMALGIPGYVLGFTPLLKKKVQNEASKNLKAFIAKNQSKQT